MYEFEEAAVRDFLRRTSAKRVAIQLPAGLRKYLSEVESAFRDSGVEFIVLADSCYGACDLADVKARQLDCDALVHYGHADMRLHSSLPILYVEARAKTNPLDSVKLAIPQLKFKRAGLVTTVQHIGYIEELSKLILSYGIQPVVGKPGPRAKYPGQILGCDIGSAKSIADGVDGFIYVGTGEFHPLGVALATGKRVAVVNPISGEFRVINPDNKEFIQKRKAAISRAALGEKIGVVASTKTGQSRLELAKRLVSLIERKGKVAHLLVVDEINPETIGNFGLDAFVCVACPRIPIDDAASFERPILTPFEAMAMLGEVPFEPYRIDEFYEVSEGQIL